VFLKKSKGKLFGVVSVLEYADPPLKIQPNDGPVQSCLTKACHRASQIL